MVKTFPELANPRIDFAWSSTFALTLARIPRVGPAVRKRLFHPGHSGHDVATTNLLGKTLGEAVARHAERFDLRQRR